MIDTLKKVTYPVIDRALERYGAWRAERCDLEPTIVVAGTGRSGTTWLAEIINTLPGRHILYEPFNLNGNPKCRKLGFTWNTYIPPTSSAPEKREYVEQILDGRELSSRTLMRRELRPMRLLRLRGYVTKTINANLMLSWMSDRFPVKAILLTRHPCAVVASQLLGEGWDWATRRKVYFSDEVFEDYPHLGEIYEDISSIEENLAFEWAVQTYIPIDQGGGWTMTTYERLVSNEIEEARRIFNELRFDVPDEVKYRMSEESASQSAFEKKEDFISGWRDRLGNEQIERIMEIVHRVGVDFYTEDLHPSYEDMPISGS